VTEAEFLERVAAALRREGIGWTDKAAIHNTMIRVLRAVRGEIAEQEFSS
jgi:hypothetical protein